VVQCVKRPLHGKLKLANSYWQTQVEGCERRKNSLQTRSICGQQFANFFADCFSAVHTHQLEFANFSVPCEGRFRFQCEFSVFEPWLES